MTKMKILIDGKEVDSDDIVIIWEGISIYDGNNEVKDAWLELKPTYEGIILDACGPATSESYLTGSNMVDDLIEDFCK